MNRNVSLTRTPFLAKPPEPGTQKPRTPIRRVSGKRARITAGSPAAEAKSAATRRGGSGKLTPPAPSEFTPKVKLLVRKRAGRGDIFEALAECCGTWLGETGGEYQHRAARGAGGCRDEVVNGPANCLLMCPEHHRQAEDRDRHLGMDEAGFWIEHGTTPAYDPRNVRIMLHDASGGGIPVYLAADGLGPDGSGYLLQPPGAVAA